MIADYRTMSDVPTGSPKPNRFELRASDEALSLMQRLASRFGISRADVVEMAIRELARKEGLIADARTPSGDPAVNETGETGEA